MDKFLIIPVAPGGQDKRSKVLFFLFFLFLRFDFLLRWLTVFLCDLSVAASQQEACVTPTGSLSVIVRKSSNWLCVSLCGPVINFPPVQASPPTSIRTTPPPTPRPPNWTRRNHKGFITAKMLLLHYLYCGCRCIAVVYKELHHYCGALHVFDIFTVVHVL